jgi:acyl-homoserine-lactone acylase
MVLNPDDFPAYMSPREIQFRSQRSINMLHTDAKISFDELVQYKHSTRMEMADRILDDLISAVRQTNSPLANKAADVLAAWDRKADAGSKGAVLFAAWVDKMGAARGESPGIYAQPWKETAPLTTPDGLADPKEAAAALEEVAQRVIDDYGALDIPWGDVYRLRYENIDLPANGGNDNLGIFRAVRFYPDRDKRFCSYYGDSFVAVVEFSNPVKARVLLSYGNSTQLHSAHRGDQLELFVKKKLRPVWRSRKEIEKHLEKKEKVRGQTFRGEVKKIRSEEEKKR